MAVVLHPLIFGKASGNIIHAFEAQSGFELTFREMKAITYSKLRTVAYDGQPKEVMAHVKGKGTKKGESLRVHFFADYARSKIVIAHCGEHLQTYEAGTVGTSLFRQHGDRLFPEGGHDPRRDDPTVPQGI